MLLTISTTYQPATDLGYLLYKHPGRLQSFELPFGYAHVFYPETREDRCTAALLLEIDPVDLVRGSSNFPLAQYVNDRPYVASSFLSVALGKVFGSALKGTARERPELAQQAIPLEISISVVPSRGGETLLTRLFEPLGYKVETERQILDPQFPDWGMSPYYTLKLRQTIRLADMLGHLYILLPVLDNDKHYYVDQSEVQKLLDKAETWLNEHPEKGLIVRRYLKYRNKLQAAALAQLAPDLLDEADQDAEEQAVEAEIGPPELSLHEQRLAHVTDVLKASGARRIVDLGCGEGKLVRHLLAEKQFTEILAMDVSHQALEIATKRLKLKQMPDLQRKRISLIHGSLMYRDARIAGYDAAAVVEVIEHLDEPRLAAFERSVFEFAQPGTVVVTTPNREYNVKWESLPAGTMRHKDHRFEWTRAEFTSWAEALAERFGYNVRFAPIGPEDPDIGAPSQMAIFERAARTEGSGQ